jgi:hypothetical protein
VNLWLVGLLRRAGYEPTLAQWRIAMWILAVGAVVAVIGVVALP